jgi:hypothetical protein
VGKVELGVREAIGLDMIASTQTAQPVIVEQPTHNDGFWFALIMAAIILVQIVLWVRTQGRKYAWEMSQEERDLWSVGSMVRYDGYDRTRVRARRGAAVRRCARALMRLISRSGA